MPECIAKEIKDRLETYVAEAPYSYHPSFDDIETYFDIKRNEWWHDEEIHAYETEFEVWVEYMEPEDVTSYTISLDQIDLAVIHRIYKEFGWNVTKEQMHRTFSTLKESSIELR